MRARVNSGQKPRHFNIGRFALPLLSTIALMGVLEVLHRAGYLPIFIPAPLQLVDEVLRNPRLITSNLGPTVDTAVKGYLIAAVVTMAVGTIGVLFNRVRSPIYNTGVILNSIPIIATAPLLATWMGTGPSLHATIAALASQFAMLVSTMQGLTAADTRQKELFHALSASRWQSLRHLLLPSALPYLFAGFKIAAPSAVLGAITAEWTGADRGIGAMMLYALFSYDIVKVWLSVLLTSILATAAYGFWAFIEYRVVFWARGTEIS